jgi:hypothetical protein
MYTYAVVGWMMTTYQSCAQPSDREIAPRDIEKLTDH